jgi:transcriptional regulator with XRE-family HTH domain
MSTFGERLAKIRKIKDLTTKELGLKCDMSDGTISNIETGNTPSPGLLVISKIVNGLQLSPEEKYWLLFGEELKTAQEEEIDKLKTRNERLVEANLKLIEQLHPQPSRTPESSTQEKAGEKRTRVQPKKPHPS